MPTAIAIDESEKLDTGLTIAVFVDPVESAQAAGLRYVHIPVRGAPGPAEVEAVRRVIDDADGPVLSYCRSGTRSITTWSIGQAMSGAMPRGELVQLGRAAGYDLSGVLGA
jgi:uncharacterized protein (TIGR01244 family)